MTQGQQIARRWENSVQSPASETQIAMLAKLIDDAIASAVAEERAKASRLTTTEETYQRMKARIADLERALAER